MCFSFLGFTGYTLPDRGACAQAGALVAGIWFNYLTSASRFYVSAFFNLAGLVLTILFVRPTFKLDLNLNLHFV